MADITQIANAIGGVAYNSGQDGEFFGARGRTRKVKYWKMCDRPNCGRHQNRKGWVTIGPVMATDPFEHAKFVSSKHMTELPDEYGVEVVGAGPMTHIDDTIYNRYYTIILNGGLKEFPPDQIVYLGWYKIPEVVNALDRKTRDAVEMMSRDVKRCPYGCYTVNGPREFFNDRDLSNHIRAMHKEAVAAVAVSDAVMKSSKIDTSDLASAFVAALKAFERVEMPDKVR